jgi:hypothetical protein
LKLAPKAKSSETISGKSLEVATNSIKITPTKKLQNTNPKHKQTENKTNQIQIEKKKKKKKKTKHKTKKKPKHKPSHNVQCSAEVVDDDVRIHHACVEQVQHESHVA